MQLFRLRAIEKKSALIIFNIQPIINCSHPPKLQNLMRWSSMFLLGYTMIQNEGDHCWTIAALFTPYKFTMFSFKRQAPSWNWLQIYKKKNVNNLMVIYIVSCTSFETITYIHIGNYDLLTPNWRKKSKELIA